MYTDIKNDALQITAIYVLIGSAWILFSDTAVQLLVSDHELLTRLSVLKGWFFVALTGALLYRLISQSQRILQRQNTDLAALNEELLASEEELRQQVDELMSREEKIHKQNLVLQTLHTTALGLMQRLELEGVFQNIATCAAQLINTEHVFILLADETAPNGVRRISRSGSEAQNTYFGELWNGLSGQVYSRGEIMVIDDYSQWEHRIVSEMTEHIKAIVQVPLKVQHTMVGVLELAFIDSPRKFGQEELALLSRFAELASIALDNATLLDTYKRELAERIQAEDALKQSKRQLEFLSHHDSLTGLYNRAYFEKEINRLSRLEAGTAGIILCDLDGLKMINDTLGHSMGDEVLRAVASVLQRSFASDDMVARIGGDEFAVILPSNSLFVFDNACERIRRNIELYNEQQPTVPISLSMGFAVSKEIPIDAGALFKEADHKMYREKLHRQKSKKSAVIKALMKALEARDFITEGHGDRLQDLVEALAMAVGLPAAMIADLRLLARFHDIGKVGIPDHILFKPARLTEEEFLIMQSHCEIGYRIAKTAPELEPIADGILRHQEWWNGEGYPLGIGGQDIPIECRILAIADAYDAMTNERPYRQAMSREAAIDELRRGAGTQFDPALVEPFIQIIQQKQL